MRSDAKLAPSLAALTSLALHALVLASAVALSAEASTAARPLPPDRWAARAVEVGTVPDATPKAPETVAARPAPEPPPRAPAPEEAPSRDRTPEVKVLPRRATVAARSAGKASSTATPSVPPPEPSSAAASADSGGSIGATGLPPGVRHLATAFTRALPAGGYKDAAWTELPLGKVGDAVVALRVDESGRLEDVEVEPERGLPPALDRMIQRVVLLLKSGTFSLDPSKVSGAGTERLTLEVTLSTRPANPDELAAPGDLFGQSFASPRQDRPGYARFTLNSGRHVEAIVRFAESGPK